MCSSDLGTHSTQSDWALTIQTTGHSWREECFPARATELQRFYSFNTTVIQAIKNQSFFLEISALQRCFSRQMFHDGDDDPNSSAKNIMITFFQYEDDSPILNDEDHRGHFAPSAWTAMSWRGDTHYIQFEKNLNVETALQLRTSTTPLAICSNK